MNSREIVARTIRFEGPERMPYDLPTRYGSDFIWVNMAPSPDDRPKKGPDEWGAVWDNLGHTQLGEVKDWPLKDWKDFDRLHIPNIRDPRRWAGLAGVRQQAGDKFLLGLGISIYARAHYIRGLENLWVDIYEQPEQLARLLDVLVDMNTGAIQGYSAAGIDGYFMGDDWGLQDRLMIAPKCWRQLWKPRYQRIFAAAHQAGMFTFLHSCGYIVEILDDLIEAGLDVIQMDQQENMGLELLGRRFGGRLTFYCPVDIQNTMVYGTPAGIRAYCREMVDRLGRPEGGFIAKWYSDPASVGHRPEAIDAMCQEFIRLAYAPGKKNLRIYENGYDQS